MLYHWEDDANTGFIDWSEPGYYWQVTGNANQAARNAWAHGISLGSRLPTSLRRVHLIAHSAGAWCAYQVASALVANPYVVVQVTLLDPYIPNEVPGYQGDYPDLSDATINGMANWPFSSRLFLLENYYADDALQWDSTQTSGPTWGTQETFTWPGGNGVNLLVAWGPVVVPPPPNPAYLAFYDFHSGPTLFYGDTIKAANLGPGEPPPSRLPPRSPPYIYQAYGWFSSLFHHVQLGALPRITSQPTRNTTVTTGSLVTLTVQANSILPLSYQWLKRGQADPISGATGASYAFTASSGSAGDYVVRVSDSTGMIFSDFATVGLTTGPPAPTTFNVAASSGPNGSISPNGTFARNAGSSVTLTAAATSGYEIDRWYVNGLVAQSGGASYTIANLQADTSVQATFRTAGTVVLTGSVLVNLAPAAAVSAGAQWRFAGGNYQPPGVPFQNLGPGQYQISFKPLSGYNTPGDQSVSVVANQQTTVNASYSSIPPSTYTLTLNQGGSTGYISPSPFGTWNGSADVYTAGSVIQLTANAYPGYHFVGWGGDLSGAANPATITMSANRSVTANFASGDPNMGTVIVTIQPPAAVAAGVKWGTYYDNYRDSGTSYTTWAGGYFIVLHPVDGWISPIATDLLPVTLTGGQTTNYTVTFTPDTTPGLLTVTVTPPTAAAAGAAWHANGGAAQGSGTTASLLPGTYTVTFDSIPGWTAPQAQTVQVVRSQTAVLTGNYTPPAGQPVINAIQPRFGSLAGGTPVTIEGINFTAPVTVWIGGIPATNVNVLSPSQITCLTPSNSVYGTQPVVVQTSGGSTTNLNGFAYGLPRGSGIELAGSIGGNVSAVAAQGNYCYIGEGSTFTVLGMSNPSAPSPIGHLATPGLVQDVVLFTNSGRQYAAVADDDAGLQIVDVTTATAPALRGYYNTGDEALGVAVFGTNAYVANGNSGVMVFDISNPIQPRFLGSLATGYSDKLAVQASSGSVFVYVSAGGALVVVDVTTPSNPVLRGQTSAITTRWEPHCLAVSGDRAFLADAYDYLQPIDITNPNSPTPLGSVSNNTPSAITITNGRVYTSGPSGLFVYNLVNGSLTQIGYLYSNLSIQGNSMAVVNGVALCGGGQNGLAIFDVSTPTNPIYRGLFGATDGTYTYAAINGKDAYVATLNSGLKIFDVSDPANPSLESQFVPSFNGGEYVQIFSNRAYFLSGGQINILDISNPSHPIVLGTNYTIPFFTRSFYVTGNFIVAGGYDRSTGAYLPAVETINVSDPGSLTIQSLLDLTTVSGGAWGTTGNGNIACAAVPLASGGDSSLAVINVSNPSNLQQIGQLPDIGMVYTMRLAPDNRYLYVGCFNVELSWKIIDLANSNSPVLVSSNYVGSGVYGFDFSGTTAYVAAGRNVLVYDVSGPAQPKLIRSYTTPNVALDVKLSGSTLFVSDATGGFIILKLSDIDPPEVFISVPTSFPACTNTTGVLNLGGTADDNLGLAKGTVTSITWTSSRGGGGNATGTTNWSANGITLLPGTNVLTVTAFDQAGNSSNATLTVIYQSTSQNQTITFPAIADRTFGSAPIPLVAAASSGLPVNFNVVSGSASLSNNVLALTGAGVVTVQANQPGNGSFNAATPVQVSFNVARADQAIAFVPVPAKSVGDAPFVLSATASSVLPVTFAIMSGPATVVSNVVTLNAAGIVTVRASQSGNANYSAALDVDLSFGVAKLPQFITFGSLGRQVFGDAPFALAGTASSGLPVSFSVLSGPATVSGNMVTLAGPGLVVLRASQAGDGTYAPAPNVDQVLMVAPGNNVVTDLHWLANGMFSLRFYGEPGTNWVVQASTNLVNWLPLSTNQVGGLGYLEFTDSSATNYSRRFYRIAP